MKNLLSRIYDRLPGFLRNKYLIAIALFIIWILLFDNNNLIDRFHDLKALKQLQNDKEYYTRRIEEDERKLNELRTNDKNLEKFAREEYHMKKDDEDIFILITEEEEKEASK